MRIVEKYRSVPSGNGQTDSGIRCLYDISFPIPQVGWCVGSGQILLTTDGGESWKNFFSRESELPYGQANKLFVRSENECWIPSHFFSECCYTRDMGKSWKRIKLDDGFLPADICFSGERGWIVAMGVGESSYNGAIYNSQDGGVKWTRCKIQLRGQPLQIKFPCQDDGFLLESYLANGNHLRSNLYFTKNGGIAWQLMASFDNPMTSFDLTKDGRIIVAGETGIFLLNSASAGEEAIQIIFSEVPLNAIVTSPVGLSLALGDLGRGYFSIDNGVSWNPLRFKTSHNLVSGTILSNKEAMVISSTSIYQVCL